MATYTNAFTTTENPISDGGALTAGPGAFGNILTTGGKARAAASAQDDAFRVDTPTIGANQYAQFVFTTTGGAGTGGRDAGPLLRINSPTDGDAYGVDLDPNSPTTVIFRVADTGTLAFTTLGAALASPTNGHTYKFMVTGTTLELFDNGSSMGTRTDATYSTGQPGLYLQATTPANLEADDYVAGEPTAATRDADVLIGVAVVPSLRAATTLVRVG